MKSANKKKLYTVQREDAHTQIKPQLKVEIEDGREAP